MVALGFSAFIVIGTAFSRWPRTSMATASATEIIYCPTCPEVGNAGRKTEEPENAESLI
jgi:hypothetical protein